jgi:hypothetical protein
MLRVSNRIVDIGAKSHPQVRLSLQRLDLIASSAPIRLPDSLVFDV